MATENEQTEGQKRAVALIKGYADAFAWVLQHGEALGIPDEVQAYLCSAACIAVAILSEEPEAKTRILARARELAEVTRKQLEANAKENNNG